MTSIPDQIKTIRQNQPQNIMAATLDLALYNSLDTESQQAVKRIIQSGLENPTSQVGAYAMQSEDYDKYAWLLAPIVQKYHQVTPDFKHISDWGIAQQTYDLRDMDPTLDQVSMRVRVARNDPTYPLPGGMSKQDRIAFEDKMVGIFQEMMKRPGFNGRYVSLTPGSSYQISPDTYQQLVAQHKIFKDMSADPHLKSAGIANDWPHGRGMYEADNGKWLVWVGEEDHLRLICMERGSNLTAVFHNLLTLQHQLEQAGITFATSEKIGFVASCPTNIGTGMRASVHIPLPNLLKDEANLKKIARAHGLAVRGVGGEHTQYGADGLVDISPSTRLGKTEVQILAALYDGIAALIEAEKKQHIF